MWTFYQNGVLVGPDGTKRVAYSGKGVHKNDPDSQHIHDLGPIPCGLYAIGAPVDTHTHGPYVLPLTPDSRNIMFDRAGFLIHGDSIVEPGTASEGCIVVGRAIREAITKSGDLALEVKPIYKGDA